MRSAKIRPLAVLMVIGSTTLGAETHAAPSPAAPEVTPAPLSVVLAAAGEDSEPDATEKKAKKAGKKKSAKAAVSRAIQARRARAKARRRAVAEDTEAKKAPKARTSARKPTKVEPLEPTNVSNEVAPDAPLRPKLAAPKPRPRKVIHYKDVAPTPTESTLMQALELQVQERGPYSLWDVRIRNKGGADVSLFDDPRLLWFEATVPGSSRSVTCELPNSMRPSRARDRARVTLEPGRELHFRIDPRLYCFESGDQTILVPGSQIEPHYGWRSNQRTVWEGGKRRQLRLAQAAPYAFKPEQDSSGGLKEVSSASFPLGSAYAAWSKARLPVSADGERGLELAVARGSDVVNARAASVQVAIENHGTENRRLHLRAEQLTFVVWGPDGEKRCEPGPELRALNSANRSTIRPGKSTLVTVRLSEFCPSDTFTSAGLYYVSAALPLPDEEDAPDTLDVLPVAAGEIATTQEEPAAGETNSDDTAEDATEWLSSQFARPIRIQTGDAPFRPWMPADDVIGPADEGPPDPADSPAPAGR
jgi:hypothetical protein